MAIANSDGSIVLTTKVDQSGLTKGMSTIKSGVSSLMSSVGKLGAAMGVAFSIGAILKFSKEASNIATDLEASSQRLIDIYGSASQEVEKFINANARALGMSKSAATSFSAVYGNLFSVWADQATNAELTNRYLNMTAVIASKTGRSVSDVQERVRSGLLGNTEAIEDLGVFVNVKTIEMTDAFQRMAGGKSWEQLDAYTQQQIRSMAILEQATDKYGDEVADTTATVRNRFQAAYEDFQATWGRIVNMVLIPVLKTLTSIFDASVMFLETLFGTNDALEVQKNLTDEIKDNQEKLAESANDTADAQERSFANFDKIQTLQSKSSQKKINTENSLLDPNKNDIKEQKQQASAISKIAESLRKLAEPLTSIKSSVVTQWQRFVDKVIVPISETVIDEYLPTIMDNLAEALDFLGFVLDENFKFYNQFVDEFIMPIWENVSPTIAQYFEDMGKKLQELFTTIEQSEAFEDLRYILSRIYEVLGPLVELVIEFSTKLSELAMSIFIDELIRQFKNWGEIISAIADLLRGDLPAAFEHLKTYLYNSTIGKLIDRWEKFFEKLSEFSQWVRGFQGKSLASGAVGAYTNVPKLAQGAVLPPNKPFLSIVGDQKHGTNIEAPLDTIVEAFNIANKNNGQNVNIEFTGSLSELARILKPVITLENQRDSAFA